MEVVSRIRQRRAKLCLVAERRSQAAPLGARTGRNNPVPEGVCSFIPSPASRGNETPIHLGAMPNSRLGAWRHRPRFLHAKKLHTANDRFAAHGSMAGRGRMGPTYRRKCSNLVEVQNRDVRCGYSSYEPWRDSRCTFTHPGSRRRWHPSRSSAKHLRPLRDVGGRWNDAAAYVGRHGLTRRRKTKRPRRDLPRFMPCCYC